MTAGGVVIVAGKDVVHVEQLDRLERHLGGGRRVAADSTRKRVRRLVTDAGPARRTGLAAQTDFTICSTIFLASSLS